MPRKSRRGRALSGRGEAGVLQNAGATGEEAPALFGGYRSLPLSVVSVVEASAFGISSESRPAEHRNVSHLSKNAVPSCPVRNDKCDLVNAERLSGTIWHGIIGKI